MIEAETLDLLIYCAFFQIYQNYNLELAKIQRHACR